ncbi:flagellar basal body rod protein FlgC [Paraburkholderia sp. IW21]|uniref:flagellar basal body rod protein FlgC n=1 Tax=Paraburkholderia sp. IW21 TaxID=3242488 RepID=UPI003522135F
MSDSIFAIARSGMDVEHQRMEVIAQNLANAGTTQTAAGTPYQPMRLVSGPRVVSNFPAHLQAGNDVSGMDVSPTEGLAGVQTYGVEPMETQPRLVYEPSHPHADGKGFVHYPGLDHAGEMALMVQTQRVYEANVIMFNAARSMYLRALDLGSKG